MPSGRQHGLKKAIGALKDSTKVGLARVSDQRVSLVQKTLSTIILINILF